MEIIYYNRYFERKNDKKKYGNLKDELDRIESRISNANNINDITFYQDISKTKKIMRFAESKGGYRLALYFYENYCLFIDFEIKQKLENVKETSEILFENKDNDYFINYIHNHKKEIKTKKIDLNNYNEILNFIEQSNKDEIILENQKFVNYLEINKKILPEIFKLLGNTLLDFENNLTYKEYKSIYKISDDIFYKFLPTDEAKFLYLFTKDDNLKTIDQISSKDELLKRSIKSYPIDIFLEDDENGWIEYIVKNNDGNIALSPEEENILLKLKSFNNEKYPFFINGRAGSGKSTILQYLFASYLVKFLELKQKVNLEYEPLYLTYNDRLKDKAIDKVISIILAQTPKELKDKLNLKERKVIYRQIEEYFKSFDVKDGYSFLEELLYLSNSENSLQEYKKLTYEEIKEYFDNLSNKKGNKYKKTFSAELIWYVIRSFIKGRGIIKNDKLQELTLEEYKNLPRNIKTLDDETYKIIYNEFYQTYKKYLRENNYYDDLDLVFEVYRKNAFDKKYSIIFCDETQDFTKIEFNLILNLNIFLQNNIKVSNFDPKKIPIVFAGDPFQTINPTGFSFEYLKALVYESYQHKGFKNISLNDEELKFNYRSNEEIIKFANLIQLLRAVLFKNNIELQEKWLEKNENNSVLFFENIKKEDYYLFIFPTNNRSEYQKNDKLFNSLEIEYLNTPVDVKGLEENVVVIYKFGDYYIKNYNNIEKFIENGFSSKEESLKYEYFFNIFYVAITRAKRRLIIVDTESAKKEFWEKIDIDKLFNKVNLNIDKNNLLSYKEGQNENLDENDEKKLIYTSEKLKTDIFERYETNKDTNKKLIILNDIRKVIKNQKNLNSIYKDILLGLEAEVNQNYLSVTKNLMQAVNKAKKNKELSNEQISLLIRKSFDNLFESVLDEDNKSLEFLKQFKENFINIGIIKYERKTKLLDKFLNKRYNDVINYIIDEFDKRDYNKTFKFILNKTLTNLDDYELIDSLKDLKNKDLIDNNEIIEIIRYRFEKSSNYKTLIKIFDEELKNQYKELYCKINLQINEEDIDCLMYSNEIAKALKIAIKKNLDVNQYYRQILYYISKEKKFDILKELNFDLIVENYLKFYEEFDIEIWNYIIKSTFNNKENKNDIISKVVKFFENKPQKIKSIHAQVLIDVFKEYNQIFLNKVLFNTFITIFSSIDLKICDVIYSLEHTYSFYDEDNIKKLLGFYGHYLRDKNKKYKGVVGSRYIKIMYEYSKYDREKFEEEKKSANDTFLDYIKRKVKFLKAESDENILYKIPSRLKYNLCQKIYNTKLVDDIYKKIIDELTKEDNKEINNILKESQKRLEEDLMNAKNVEIIQEKLKHKNENNILITKDNIIDILENIQDFLDENQNNFTKKEIKKLYNTLSGLKNDIEELRKKVETT